LVAATGTAIGQAPAAVIGMAGRTVGRMATTGATGMVDGEATGTADGEGTGAVPGMAGPLPGGSAPGLSVRSGTTRDTPATAIPIMKTAAIRQRITTTRSPLR